MDKPIRKYVLWKCRHLDLLEERLERMRERMEEIIDESGSIMDGQPRAKYNVTDVVTNKVLKREQIDFSIKRLEYEIRTIKEFPNSLQGYERRVFDETITKISNLQAKADLIGVGRKKLIEDRGKLLRQVAVAIGEYIDE